jgi:hypothetical protein
VESSALSGENVEEIFNKTIQTLIYKIDNGEIPEDLVMTNKQISSLSSAVLGMEDSDRKKVG